MSELTEEEFLAAKAAGDLELAGPRARAVYFDDRRNRVVVELTTGMEISFPPQIAQGLQNAAKSDLKKVEIDVFGLAIRFPTIDEDFYVPGLLKGALGSEKWMAMLRQNSDLHDFRIDRPRVSRERSQVVDRARQDSERLLEKTAARV